MWYTFLDDIVHNYNTQVNRSIQERPIDVTEENKHLVWNRLFGHIAAFRKPRYGVGDRVRVLHFTPALKGKAFQTYWKRKNPPRKNPKSGRPVREEALGPKNKSPFSDEIFTVNEVLIGDPVVYKLYSPEAKLDILGKFYESELSLVR